MANKPELGSSYGHIQTDEKEMARYRRNLAVSLPDRKPNRIQFNPLGFGLAAAAILCVAILLFPSRSALFPQERRAEIESMIAHRDSGELGRLARQQLRTAFGIERLNAMMVVCLTQPEGQALQIAAEGALSDPRSDFRSFYLEYLLDYADEYQLNADLIEERMDQETDEECLYLYGRLLKLATFS